MSKKVLMCVSCGLVLFAAKPLSAMQKAAQVVGAPAVAQQKKSTGRLKRAAVWTAVGLGGAAALAAVAAKTKLVRGNFLRIYRDQANSRCICHVGQCSVISEIPYDKLAKVIWPSERYLKWIVAVTPSAWGASDWGSVELGFRERINKLKKLRLFETNERFYVVSDAGVVEEDDDITAADLHGLPVYHGSGSDVHAILNGVNMSSNEVMTRVVALVKKARAQTD